MTAMGTPPHQLCGAELSCCAQQWGVDVSPNWPSCCTVAPLDLVYGAGGTDAGITIQGWWGCCTSFMVGMQGMCSRWVAVGAGTGTAVQYSFLGQPANECMQLPVRSSMRGICTGTSSSVGPAATG